MKRNSKLWYNQQVEFFIMTSPNLQKLLSMNFVSPSIKEQQIIMALLRILPIIEVEHLYKDLVKRKILNPPYPEEDNEKRLDLREKHYAKNLREAIRDYVKFVPSGGRYCDVGCGTGVLTVDLFKKFLNTNGEIFCCDVVDYISQKSKKYLQFSEDDAISYLKRFPNNFFNVTMEVVALHHLDSKANYRACIKEMIRTTKKEGLVIIVETVHSNWYQELKNALLDILLNARTSNSIIERNKVPIRTPINFLSDRELKEELKKKGLRILNETELSPTQADPKFHKIYVCRK